MKRITREKCERLSRFAMRKKDRARRHFKRLSDGYTRYLRAFRKAQDYYARKSRDCIACFDRDGHPLDIPVEPLP